MFLLSSASSVVESFALYENHTFSNAIWPAAPRGRWVGRTGDSTMTGSSSSLKMRSDDAIAD